MTYKELSFKKFNSLPFAGDIKHDKNKKDFDINETKTFQESFQSLGDGPGDESGCPEDLLNGRLTNFDDWMDRWTE